MNTIRKLRSISLKKPPINSVVISIDNEAVNPKKLRKIHEESAINIDTDNELNIVAMTDDKRVESILNGVISPLCRPLERRALRDPYICPLEAKNAGSTNINCVVNDDRTIPRKDPARIPPKTPRDNIGKASI